MAVDVKKIAQKLRDNLSKYEDFQGLYLYGSYVNGHPEPESDVDIVAVFSQRPGLEKKLEIHGHSLDIELENDIFIDLHPMTVEELNLNSIFFGEVKKGFYYGAR